MATYFISGHLDLTADEFLTHYLPRIHEALAADGDNACFVVGDARGADLLAQCWFNRCQRSKERTTDTPFLTVYHMFQAPRNNVGSFPTVGGFASDHDRDAAMTAASDADIAWIRPGRERNGTAKNLERRGEMS